jgi:hypothetical protein
MLFHKKRARTCYIKIMFLHPERSVGHIVHSGRPGLESLAHYFSCSGGPVVGSIKTTSGLDTPNFYFYIRWDLPVT